MKFILKDWLAMHSYTLWHIHKQVVSSKVDIMDNFAKVLVEVCVSKVFQIVECILRNITFPVKVT